MALLHYTCPPVIGGVEEIVKQQALLFSRYCHNVKVFAGMGRAFSDCCEVELNPLLNSQNERVREAQQLLREGKKGRMEEISGEIYEYLSRSLKGFDVLIAHNVLTMHYNMPLTEAVCRLAREEVLPVVSWNHDSPFFYEDHPLYLKGDLWESLRQSSPKIHYVAISDSRQKRFSALYGKGVPIRTIPNGIDPIGFFMLDPTTVRIIQEQKLFEAHFIMVQPSRLHPRKNMEMSIRVVRALQDLGFECRLLLTGAYDPHEPGSRNYYRKLKNLTARLEVDKNIIFIAEYVFRSGEKLSAHGITIRDLYHIADVLFLPSLQEGFGIPLLEAGMVKLPIICSDIPPFREIGGDDVCFFGLNDPPEKVAAKVIEFCSRLETRRMFRKVIEKHAWDNIYLYKLLPFLDNIIER